MSEFDIFKEERGERHGRYVARIKGIEGEAEIKYTRRGPGLVSADHTGAPEAMRGTGVAAALVAFMVEDARQKGFKIVPRCPYVQAQYKRHPDWADVMTPVPDPQPSTA